MHRTIILIAGHGKLAEAIQTDLQDHLDCIVDEWENIDTYANEPEKIVVHIGSGRQLPAILSYCTAHGVPLIQGSTGLSYRHDAKDFTLVDAPNFNILLLKFMHMLNQFGKHFKPYTIGITESHQQAKTSVPGTAVAFAEYLGVGPKAIQSIRDREKQLNEYGIAVGHLDSHAVHVIRINDNDTTISMRTEAFGLASYVSGLATVIRMIPKLEKRFYNVIELVELNII